jgi:hypothetical protein
LSVTNKVVAKIVTTRQAWLGALLCATAACHNADDYERTPEAVGDLMSIESTGQVSSLPADGVAQVEIVVKVDSRASNKAVAFTTTGGTLIGGTTNQGAQHVLVSSSGEAAIRLRSSRDVMSVTVRAALVEAAEINRELHLEFVAPDPDTVLRFVTAPTSIPADGASLSRIVVRVNPLLPNNERTVNFGASLGTFVPGTSGTTTGVADSEGLVRADLKSPSELGIARIQAQISGYVRSIDVDVVRALPEAISVGTDALTVDATGTASILVTATMQRAIGTTTNGTRGVFSGTGSSGEAVGVFRDEAVVANGKATARYYPGTTGYRGPVTIAVGVSGSTVVGTTTINVTNPGAMSLSGVDLTDAVDELVDSREFQGVIVVSLNGTVVTKSSYGFSNVTDGRRNSADTIFPTLALSSTFLLYSVLDLAKHGYLRLDEPLSYYLADSTMGGSIREILATVRVENRSAERAALPSASEASLIQLVEQISGIEYHAYLRQTIFDRLGMLSTGNLAATVASRQRANGHRWSGGHPAPVEDVAWQTASGVLFSTANDLELWGREYQFVVPDNDRGADTLAEQISGRAPGFSVESVNLIEPAVSVLVLSNVERDSRDLAVRIADIAARGDCACD